MNGFSSDRNLLLGIMALQMDFISRDELIEAMHAWTLDKTRSLSEILVKRGALDPVERSVLESLVERHVARHGGDPEKSLSSLELVVPSRSTLESLDDPDILESLSKLGVTHTRADGRTDPERTSLWGATIEETGGRFRIISLHDEGGLGCVFLARDEEVNREVALKQMKEDIAADPQLRARFVFEAEITGNLEHPGIVPVYGKGEYFDGRPYYAMRFIRGDNLKVAVDRFHKNRAFNADSGARQREFQKLLRRFLVVCETMSYAHSRGVIHRDLKPRNILLGPYGETLVVDWGLAKIVGHAETVEPSDATLRPPSGSDVQPTAAGSRVGTPAYMSPEQARGEVERLGPAADIYSLGATLYYLLAGRAPFVELELVEILSKVEHGHFPSPREVNPSVDRALEAICLKAMALRCEDRYGSCQKLADDLEHWLADQPVLAYPEPVSVKSMRWARKRKHWVAAAAVMALLGSVGLATHDWQLGREQLLTKRALRQASERLLMTRRALREQYDLAANGLAAFPKSEPLREKHTRSVLRSYLDLRELYPEDLEICFETADVYRILGGILRITGDFNEAEVCLGKSIDLFTALVGRGHDQVRSLRLLVRGRIDRGEVFSDERQEPLGRVGLRGSLEWVERLKGSLKPTDFASRKASALINRSELRMLRGQFQQAELDAEQAVDLLASSIPQAESPTARDELRWLFAMALTDQGVALAETDTKNTVEACMQHALEVAREVRADSLYFEDMQWQKAVSLSRLGDFIGKNETRNRDSEHRYNEATGIFQQLIKGSGDLPFYREELSIALMGRARVRLLAGHLDRAEQDVKSAAVILEGLRNQFPAGPQYVSLQGNASRIAAGIRVRQGRKDESRSLMAHAVKLLEQAIEFDPDRELDRRNLAFLKAEVNQPRD